MSFSRSLEENMSKLTIGGRPKRNISITPKYLEYKYTELKGIANEQLAL